jgi:hypothetical protein
MEADPMTPMPFGGASNFISIRGTLLIIWMVTVRASKMALRMQRSNLTQVLSLHLLNLPLGLDVTTGVSVKIMISAHESRPIDQMYYGGAQEFDAALKESLEVVPLIVNPASLQPFQRRATDLIAGHYEDVLTGLRPRQMLLHVDGSIDTENLYLIDIISTRFG